MRPVGDLAAVPASILAVGDIPARIPGCAHTDLMRAGLIPDPRVGTNELDLLWIGETDWEYRASFELDQEQLAHDRIDLACDGLDTIAELSLNGKLIGFAANMFHPHRFDLRSAARPGMNELAIVFRSPLKHIRAEQSRLGPLPHNGDGLGWHPFNFIRKAACNFGWDWAPGVTTCGVWKAIRIEAWTGARIAEVRPLVRRVAEVGWSVDVLVDLEWSSHACGHSPKSVTAVIDNGDDACACSTIVLSSQQAQVSIPLSLDKPRLWWPRGHGEQNQYPLEIGMAGSARPQWAANIAFREVCLNTEPDEHGSKFQLEVNGTPIYCKGANWIPEGLFPDDRPPEAIRQRIQQAAAANMNMLRVWGGGFYESDEFYDECDKLGIMVWQDFMFSCACYPEEAPFPQLIEQEARHQIARLSTHPSVVLWCGGNECVWGFESWGHAATDVAGPWKQRVGDRTWGAGYYFDLLPRLIRELDPTRPYWPNSPFAGQRGENPNQQTRGDRHTWDAVFLNRGPGASPGTGAPEPTDYRSIIPRFCAEFGHQSPANIETLAKVLRPEDLTLTSAALEHHQKGTGGTARHINEPMSRRAAVPTDFAEWHRLAQELQAEALRNGIEHHAAHRESGRCMGVLIWQFNDAWPGMSWSLIDSDGRPKPAYEAVKEAFGRIP
jgi:beta-mannosidase